MRNLDSLLTAKGLSKEKRKSMYEKLDKLTNDQFEELYKRHDIMTDIFLVIPSPTSTDSDNKRRQKLAEDAMNDELISGALDEWTEQFDDYIEEAKTAVDHSGEVIGTGKNKITYEEWLELFE